VARFLVATHPITGHVLPGIPLDLAGHDAATESADLLERLAATGRPVYA
jgi:hypothetical protein